MHSASAKSNASACNPVTSSVSSGSATSAARRIASNPSRIPQGRAPSRRSSSKRSSRPSHKRPASRQTTCFHQTQPSYRERRACKAVQSVPVVEVVQFSSQQNALCTENRLESFTDTARQSSVETFLQQTVVAPLARTPSFRTDSVLPPNTTLLQRTTCLQSCPERTRRRGSPARHPAERPAHGESLRILHRHRKAELRRDVSPANGRRTPRTNAQLPDRRRASTKHNPLTENAVPAKLSRAYPSSR